MKKSKISLLSALLAILISLSLSGCQKESELKKVRLNEVVHSIFYVPQYVAIEKGFFLDEGIEIELTVGQGADARITQGNHFNLFSHLTGKKNILS